MKGQISGAGGAAFASSAMVQQSRRILRAVAPWCVEFTKIVRNENFVQRFFFLKKTNKRCFKTRQEALTFADLKRSQGFEVKILRMF